MCGVPAEVDHAATIPVELGAEKAYYQNKVPYQCNEGYTQDGTATGKNNFEIECLASKEFTATKTCEAVKCGAVPSVEFGTSEMASATFNESVRFDCQEGHTVDGTADGDRGFTVKCLATGTYGELQACKPISCGEPDDIPNAARPSGTKVYKDTVKYSCFEGFTLDGQKSGATDFTVECHDDGKFDNMKSCLPKVCGEPPKEINVLFATTQDEGLVRYPQTTEVMCRDGYTVGGDAGGASTFVVKCLSTGDFEQVDERECQAVRCGAPPAMPNATLSRIETPTPTKPGLTRNVWYGLPIGDVMPDVYKKKPSVTDHVDNINVGSTGDAWPGLTQKDDFVVRFSGALKIEKGGEYQFQLESDDGSFLYINGEQIVDNDGLHGMQKREGRINLEEGPQALTVMFFEKGGGAGIVLRWNGPDSGNGWQTVPSSAFQTKGGNLNYEEKAVYKCDEGFTTGGEWDAPTEFRYECLPSGELSGPSPENQCRNVNDCERHTCGKKGVCVDLVGPAPAYTCQCDHGYEIQTAANGEKFCGNVDDCQGKDCGQGVCEDLVGDYTCHCSSGYYIGLVGEQKTCVPVECAADTPSVENGRMLSTHSGAVTFPATLRYKCDVGYSTDGSVVDDARKFQAQCESDGQLVGMRTCQKITCGTPHVLPFTHLVLPGSPRRSVEYNDKAEYECDTGHTVGGAPDGPKNFEVTCQDNGVLTDPQVCEAVKCGPAPHVPHSRPGIAGNVEFGQHLEYTCDLGYTLDSTVHGATDFQRHCLEDGEFSALEIEDPCHPISAGAAPSIGNAELAEYAGASVASASVDVFYPNGVEYRCKPGYSTNGAASGPTKITARVNSIGGFTPALPSECQLISFSVRGRVKNARSGVSLSGVKITVKDTSNTVDSSWGAFTLRNVPAGTVTLVYEKADFIKTERVLTINGNVNSGGIADINMSPSMASDEWRAVVKWGSSPRDLDTYAKWGSRKVCWYQTRQSASSVEGTLEQDKTSGYGPETVYLKGVGNCRGGSSYCDINYYINDYGRTGTMLPKGEAEVTLYNGDHVAGAWKITDGGCPATVKDAAEGTPTSSGNWWHVFTINAETNQLKWSCKSDALQMVEAARNSTQHTEHTQHVKPMVDRVATDVLVEKPHFEKPHLRIKRSTSK